MNFQDFMDEGKVYKTVKDEQKIIALIKNSSSFLASLNNIKVDSTNASMQLAVHYDALRMIIEAIALKEEYNIYSHEAFSAFMEYVLKDQNSAREFDNFRKTRNKINYYGKQIEQDEAKIKLNQIRVLIERLKLRHLSEFLQKDL